MGEFKLNFHGLTAAKTLVSAKPIQTSCLRMVNEDSAARFVQIFDAAAIADVTLGTTVPDWVLVAAAGGQDDSLKSGLSFKKGIVAAATTTATGNTGAAASKVHLYATVG